MRHNFVFIITQIFDMVALCVYKGKGIFSHFSRFRIPLFYKFNFSQGRLTVIKENIIHAFSAITDTSAQHS